MSIKLVRKKPTNVDVLVLVVGHRSPEFLADTAESFRHHHHGALATSRVVFAIDGNHDCAGVLEDRGELVYCSPKSNGWGRGIIRTIAYALDYFQRQGLSWTHLITIDSDTLVIGPCLDEYVRRVVGDVCFVGQKWGGPGPYDASNPGPTETNIRQVKYLARLLLSSDEWTPVDYMVAGPFMLWTAKTLEFLHRVGVFPGAALDLIYPFILFPHDQLSTFVLGVPGHEFADAGPLSMLYCGDVGGKDDWKTGLPSRRVEPYGDMPSVPEGVAVIHPIRSSNLEEGKVRLFFRKIRYSKQECELPFNKI